MGKYFAGFLKPGHFKKIFKTTGWIFEGLHGLDFCAFMCHLKIVIYLQEN